MSGLNPPWFLQQYFTPSGKPLSGGKLFFYVAGSTVIPKAIYSDIALTTPLSQPLVLDAGGFAPEYFMEPGLYKIQVFNASMTGGAQHTRDNVTGQASTAGTGLDGAQVQIENFPFSEGNWQIDSAGELWAQSPNLCFVNIFNVHNFTQLYWFEQLILQNSGFQNANCAFWTMGSNGASPVKIYDGGIQDSNYPGRHTFTTPLDISAGSLLVFASDSPLYASTSGYCYVKQAKMSPSDNIIGFPLNSAFLATHVGGHNTVFPADSIPVCPDYTDPKYFMQMYVKIGVK